MKLLCIESVIMDVSGEQSFTKDKEYKSYKSTCKIDYDIEMVIYAKNDQGESHIIKNIDNSNLDNFYDSHFKEIK